MYILREKIETGGENTDNTDDVSCAKDEKTEKKRSFTSYFMANFGFTRVVNEHCSGHSKPLK